MSRLISVWGDFGTQSGKFVGVIEHNDERVLFDDNTLVSNLPKLVNKVLSDDCTDCDAYYSQEVVTV